MFEEKKLQLVREMKSVIMRIKKNEKDREDLLNIPEMTADAEKRIEKITDHIAILEDFLLEIQDILITCQCMEADTDFQNIYE